MELDKLVKGSVYADTNILYMYLRSDPLHLPAIKSFLKRAVKGDLEIYIGIPVLDELFYRLLLAKIKDESGANPINTFSDIASDDRDFDRIKWLNPNYRTKNHNILILLGLKQKRFAKSFYCKTALQAVSCPFQQNGLKNCPVVWAESSLGNQSA